MQKYLELNKYHSWIVIIYGILTPVLLYLGKFNYNILPEYGLVSFILFLKTLLLFICLLFLSKKIIVWDIRNILKSFLYAIIFAFPEEIIFRGVIQTFIGTKIDNVYLVIILSSLIFGAVHLTNKKQNGEGLNWVFALLAFIAGIPMGILFSITNSLFLPTILHMLFIVGLKTTSKLDIQNSKQSHT